MPVIDFVDRRGLADRFVVTGPVQLKRPRSRGSKGLGPRWGLTDVVDEFEIGVGGSGTAAGTYVISILPRTRAGIRQRINGVGRVILATRVNGIAVPTGPITTLANTRITSPDRGLVLPSRVAAAGDQLWVLLDITAASATRYSLQVDFT